MKVKSLLRTVLWITLALLLGALVMGVLFPAGRDPLVARSKSLAAQGKNVYRVLVQEGLNDDVWNVLSSSCSNYTSAAQLIEHLLSVRDVKKESAEFVNRIENIWNIAVSVSNACDSTFPIITSANFNPMLLESAIGDDTQLPIGRASGAPLTLLDDKAIILVRKDGSSEVIKAKYCTKKIILKTPHENRGSAIYLTPESKITINLAKGSAIMSPQTHQP